MTGEVQRNIDITRQILMDISERPDCVELTRYSGEQVRYFVNEGIDRAVGRYKWEAARQKRKYDQKFSASLANQKTK